MTTSEAPRQSAIRTALAGLIGNVLEWFDFAVYGFFAGDIGKQFFPQSSATAQQILAFAIFALGFFARPAGALVLGTVGDRIGRRALLTLSIALMGGATLMIGLLPGYNTIGVAAPVILVVLRIIQGFSLGGEFTGSMVYTTELAAPKLRGLISSSTAAGTTLGFLLGNISAWLVRETMGTQAASEWGWRIPFVGSVLFCVAGWLLRRGIQESAEGEKSAAMRAPIWSSLVRDWRPMIQTFGIVAMTNAAYYLTFTFVVERRKEMTGLSSPFLATMVSLTVVLFAKAFGGWLSDHVGRRRLMMILTVVGMVAVYFAFGLMLVGTPGEFLLGQCLLGVPLGMALGLQGAMNVEIYPLRTRVTSMSFAYSVTLALSGGVAPLVATWLIDVLGHPTAPVYYVMGYGVIGLLIMWPMKETNSRRLDVVDDTPVTVPPARQVSR